MNAHAHLSSRLSDPIELEDWETSEPYLKKASEERVLARTGEFVDRVKAGELVDPKKSDFDFGRRLEGTYQRFARENDVEEELGNVIRYSAPRLHPERPLVSIVAVQEWEGSVDEVYADCFTATMTDVSADAYRPTERMEIPLSLIDEEDRRVLEPGLIFRLVMGRERRRGGQIQNKTLVYIRRNKFKKRLANQESFADLFGEWT